MASLKNVDRYEYTIDKCLKTKCISPINVLNNIEKNNDRIIKLELVVIVSTDKASEPTNVYCMPKALVESAIV